MSSPSQPACVHYGDWDDQTRAHRCMNWTEQWAMAFERKENWERPYTEWQTSNTIFIKSDGATFTGAESWEATKAVYAPLAKFHHESYFLICVGTDYGWEGIGQATIYANLPGERGAGEPPRVRDKRASGEEEWDVAVPGAFRFEYVKNDQGMHDGIRVRKTEIMSDSLSIVMTLAKRVVISLS
jgi:hypothetical protein